MLWGPVTIPTNRGTTIEVYKSTDGWRWNERALNGRIVADSGEAYTRRRAAVTAATRNAGQDPLPSIPPKKRATKPRVVGK